MVPPYSASLHRLRHPMFEVVLFLVTFVFTFYGYCSYFCPCISASPLGHRNTRLFSGALCRCSFFCFFSPFFFFVSSFVLFFLAFRLVLACRPPVGPSPRHIIGLIVPANRNRVPSGLGLRPARLHKAFCCCCETLCTRIATGWNVGHIPSVDIHHVMLYSVHRSHDRCYFVLRGFRDAVMMYYWSFPYSPIAEYVSTSYIPHFVRANYKITIAADLL